MATRSKYWLYWLLVWSLLLNLLPPGEPLWAQEPPVDDAGSEPLQQLYLPLIEGGATAAPTTGEPPVDENGDEVIADDLTVLAAGLPRPASACDLYPIALHSQTVANVAPGTLLTDIFNGAGPGNFGWLTWNGKNGLPYLVASLTPPGNAHTYRNPNDRKDHLVSLGDWVQGRPGVSNSQSVRTALNRLKQLDINLPIWNLAQGSGANSQYQVTDVATVRLTDYRLPGQNRISVRFLGYNHACLGNQPPIAVDDAYTTAEDAPLRLPAPGVLANDRDPEGHSLKAIQLGDVEFGRLDFDLTGAFLYTPTLNFHGVDTFIYQASDDTFTSNIVTVTITVNPVNDAPIATDDQAVTREETPVIIPVLANDLDVDGDPLQITQVGSAVHGVAATRLDQTIAYTPALQFNGSDVFTYTLCDLGPLCATAAVTVVVGGVNDPPVANDDQATTPEDTPVTINVAANDSDPDGNLLPGSAMTLTNPISGMVAIGGNGLFTYTPNPNRFGLDHFRYTICDDGTPDGVPLCANATVTITVTPVNDPPLAFADHYTATEDLPLTLAAPGVLLNDQDVDGDALTVRNATQPTHGNLVQNPDGSLVYTPAADYCGADGYSYTLSDGQLEANAQVTLSITCVNDPPLAQDDVYTLTEGAPLTVAAPGVLGNDTDPDGDALVVSNHTQPTHGALTQSADGGLTYTPQAGFCGVDSYLYTVADGKGGSAEATVMLNVTCVNAPPTAANDSYTVNAGQTLTVPAPGVLGNDSDPENDSLTALLVNSPANGTLILQLDGSFVYTPISGFNGVDSFTYTANDATLASAVATVAITVNATTTPQLPPDPAQVAPPVEQGVATNLAAATEFLYTGATPIQTGVVAGTIEARRVAVVRGKVLDRAGNALPGVNISILNHPEFGETFSRADGMFDMAVNGGGLLTVSYQKEGYLSAQRQVQTPWQDFVWADDVVLIQVDSQVTVVDLTANVPVQVAQGSSVTDADGTRQATLLIPQGTSAQIVLPNGVTQTLTTLHVRATEYTVGANGVNAMPAQLPPQSGYTYAVELSADEALAAGATDVRFSQPLYFYVENFLNFPVGGIVPAGYYDAKRGQWIPSQNGRIIRILSTNSSLANLDIDGSGQAAGASALAALGITDVERQQLATHYSTGQSLWRVPITHFTPWDCNWPYGPPQGAAPPSQPQPNKNSPPIDDYTCQGGSIIECESQTLREAIEVAGTPFQLYYGSDRVPSRADDHTVDIPLSGQNIPPNLKRIDLQVTIGGRRFTQSFDARSQQTATFIWDGSDAYGRAVKGNQPVETQISYVYDGVYMEPAQFANSFGAFSGVPIRGNRTRQEISLEQIWQGSLGGWDATVQKLGGWSLNIHHAYDPVGRVLYLGDGRHRIASKLNLVIATVVGSNGGSATQATLNFPTGVAIEANGNLYIVDSNRIRQVSPNGIITTVAGNGIDGYSGDGGPAAQASLRSYGMTVGPDGSLYIADMGNHRIRQVSPNGIITTVVGNGIAGYSGDGGPATQASLNFPDGVAIGSDGSLYIADRDNRRIRRVAPDGIITTVVGNGIADDSGDNGPASQASLRYPYGVAIGPDGSLYIADRNSSNIRRVAPDGIITTLAGNGNSGDGELANQARLIEPKGVTVGPDGSIYIVDESDNLIRHVASDGIITTIAGNGVDDYSGDRGPATQGSLGEPEGVAIGPDGSLYIADTENDSIRRVAPLLPKSSVDDIVIAAEDGSELYVFDPTGRHLRTLHALTGAVLYAFSYDSEGRLTTVTDGDENVTMIERAANGDPTAIIAPFGQRTILGVGANGYLANITNPANEAVRFTYSGNGLMTTMSDARGGIHHFVYDDVGRLVRDEDPVAGVKTLARTENANGYLVTYRTALGQTTQYQVERQATGGLRRLTTLPDGTQVEVLVGTDGSESIRQPDGTRINRLEGPDPRFGMQAPLIKQQTITTPGGRVSTLTTERTITPSNANNPFSLVTLTEQVTINGRRSTSTYVAASRTFTTTTPAGRQHATTIDALGRVVREQMAGLEPVNYTYDARGRLETVTQGSGATTRTTRMRYNNAGYLESITDPLGRAVQFQYDAAGRVTQQTLPDNRIIAYSYDANGNVTALTPPGRPAHRFTYTPVDLEESYTPPDLGSGATATQNSYDRDRQATQVALPSGQTLNFSYDNAGRLSGMTFSRGAVAYNYASATGQLTGITAPGGLNLTFAYDGSLLTTESWSGAIAGNVGRSYDNDFRVTTLSVNGANPIAFQYDADSLLTRAGALTLVRNTQNGLLTGSTLGNVTDSWGYNGFGEPSSYNASYSGASLYQTQFTRDALGRITTQTETIAGVTTVYSYTYDLAGRLVEVKQNGATTASYTYDANGNRLSYTNANGTVTGSYDAQDRLLQYGNAAYTYTADGRLLTKTEGGQTTSYNYDEFGNLIAVTLPDGTQIEYLIDGANRRIGKKVNGVLVQGFLYQDGLNPVAELDGTGNVVSRFVYGSRANIPDYMIKGGVTYRIIADHLGSPRQVIDVATGQVIQQMEYDEFGNVLVDTNPEVQIFGFAGGIYDAVTGLVRFGVRDYDPLNGRWAIRDPIHFDAGSLNLYVYTQNDPVNWIDPMGLSRSKVIGKFVELTYRGMKIFKGGGTFEELVKAVQAGNDVLAENRQIAKRIAQEADQCKRPPIHDTPHGPYEQGYRPHYHLYGRPEGKGHVFYELFLFLLDSDSDGDFDVQDAAELYWPFPFDMPQPDPGFI